MGRPDAKNAVCYPQTAKARLAACPMGILQGQPRSRFLHQTGTCQASWPFLQEWNLRAILNSNFPRSSPGSKVHFEVIHWKNSYRIKLVWQFFSNGKMGHDVWTWLTNSHLLSMVIGWKSALNFLASCTALPASANDHNTKGGSLTSSSQATGYPNWIQSYYGRYL